MVIDDLIEKLNAIKEKHGGQVVVDLCISYNDPDEGRHDVVRDLEEIKMVQNTCYLVGDPWG